MNQILQTDSCSLKPHIFLALYYSVCRKRNWICVYCELFQVVKETQELLSTHGYMFDYRGVVSVKGKGSLVTYFAQDMTPRKKRLENSLLHWWCYIGIDVAYINTLFNLAWTSTLLMIIYSNILNIILCPLKLNFIE